ncbi:aminoacyl-tRNA hydrolase [Paraflavitalea soli]|uniref:Aminoacyl-tRNA hydrolase n=1 Tax=Paraflavitalea soli TaxID=2315862 RepID=A0A3B7N5F8_9BACT|nr:alternative ribosome rescue aminoacyl-tRNA hydrolase ArfB [Paraflavitalea soli]AXY77311.1 aminoacyl-tRNA hydrolase [Paraflavitalea soli]
MNKIDITKEILFRTARSGGKGGQNVNKVESMVEGYFNIGNSLALNEEQKEILYRKLASKVNSEGFLQVKSQVHRSQLENKGEVVEKMHVLIEQALKKEKKRVATKPSKASREKRLESKKKQSGNKQNRQKIRPIDH